MGKTRVRRGRLSRSDPTGAAQTETETQAETETETASDAISNIAQQLKSASSEERLAGCVTFSRLVSRRLALDVLKKQRLVRLAGPLLVDPCAGVRQAAAGALRNLSITGGKEGCDVMLEQDALTSALTAFSKYNDGWQPQRKLENGQALLDTDSDVFVQIANLLLNLCECSDKAVAAANRSGVGRTLLRCLDPATFPPEVTVAAGQCLHTLSEDNAAVSELVREQGGVLRALLPAGAGAGAGEGDPPAAEPHRLLLSALAVGILINAGAEGADLSPGQVVSLLSRVLAPNVREAACRLTSNTEDANYEIQLSELSLLLTAQQVALEILTNLSGADDSSDGWADQEDAESMDGDDDDMGDVTEDSEWMEDGHGSQLPSELHEAVLGGGLLQRILSKADSPPSNVADILRDTEEGKAVCKRFSGLRNSAFLCLSNLVAALDVEELGGGAHLVDLWRRVGQLVFAEGAEGDAELLDSAATVMRASLQKLLDAGRPGPDELSAADLGRMTSRVAACQDGATRAELVRGVGLVGCLRVKGRDQLSQADNEVVQAVGQFLLEVAAADQCLPVSAEALDCLMDLYGEDCTDLAAANVQLVNRLRALQPALKAKISKQRRGLAEHYPLVATVRTNLPRFIKYKAARVAALSNGSGER